MTDCCAKSVKKEEKKSWNEKVPGTLLANVLREVRNERVPVYLGYVCSGFSIYEFLSPPIKTKAKIPGCINHTGFEDNWLEPHKVVCGSCSSDLWRCIWYEWCLEWRPGALPSAASICYYACVHCYAHFLNLALVGTCSPLSSCLWFFKICFRKYTQSFQSLCWLTGGSYECFPFESLKWSSQKCTTKPTLDF